MADLAKSVPDYSAVLEIGDDKDVKHKVDYPDIHIHDAPESLWDMPEEGTATVRYKISRKEEDREKKTCHLTLDIQSFDPDKKKKSKTEKSYGKNTLGKNQKRMDEYFK